MFINNTYYRTIRPGKDNNAVVVIDQTLLPYRFAEVELRDLEDAADAIRRMVVRGAPLISITAAYGLAMSLQQDASDSHLEIAVATLAATRPTGVNLRNVLNDMRHNLREMPVSQRAGWAWEEANRLTQADVVINTSIGEYGLALIREKYQALGRPVNILTHCNAGWLATVDMGTATAPMYLARQRDIPIHVWVDETRPRNQGASLTAWELAENGIDHTLIVDNAGGHLMQHGHVDMVIVGCDRVTAAGDVCNKIGTYLKALAAFDNDVPFYVACPTMTIDWTIRDGLRDIPIEERDSSEITSMTGLNEAGEVTRISITASNTPALNYGFDVTPARLVSGLITEHCIVEATVSGLQAIRK